MLRVSVFPSQPKYRGSIPFEASCYRCSSKRNLHRHHILNGPLRWLSEAEGLWAYMCECCHEGPYGIHSNRKTKGHKLTDAEHLKWHAQSQWEANYMRRTGLGQAEARNAWRRLAKSPLQSYDYVAEDDHADWIMQWKS